MDYTLRVKVNAESQADLAHVKAGKRNPLTLARTRTPEQLLDLIEAKGREVTEAIAALRQMIAQ